jgi:poly-gamma-glutamate synthesis protein (capsule biosynthesis protein)
MNHDIGRRRGGAERRCGPILAAALLVAAAAWAPAWPGPAPAAAQEADGARFQDARGDISFALTGDAIITRRLSVYREDPFLELRELIRGATVGFTNLEVLFHEWGPGVIPQEESGGTYMQADPEVAGELAWMGFDMVSRANNHTMDYGVGGMRATTRATEAAGLVHAGAGENLALARKPAYLETPGGRVALISVASTFDDPMMAGPQRKDLRGRPGLSPLRYERIYRVPGERLEALTAVAEGLYGDRPWWSPPSGDTLRLFGETFVASGGDGYAMETRPHPGDVEAILEQVRDAERQAAWTVVSSHTHEGGTSGQVPAEFLEEFARAAVDAGADVVVGHGPHVLRGIEIYRGRPILYSLGNFIFQNETVEMQPADNYRSYGLPPSALPSDFYDRRNEASGGGFPADAAYWESVLAVPEFRDGRLAEIRLHPVTLGHGHPRPVRGRPMLADGETGRAILEELARLSRPYGTEVRIEDGVGVVDVRP